MSNDKIKTDKPIKVCVYCNKDANTRDHVVPKSLGGTKTVSCCARCNQAKSNLYLSDFLRIFTAKHDRKKRLRFKRFYSEDERDVLIGNIKKLISTFTF